MRWSRQLLTAAGNACVLLQAPAPAEEVSKGITDPTRGQDSVMAHICSHFKDLLAKVQCTLRDGHTGRCLCQAPAAMPHPLD